MSESAMYALSIDRSDGTERETDVESLRQKSRITYVRARDGGDRQTSGQPSCTSRRENEGEREAEKKGKAERGRAGERETGDCGKVDGGGWLPL